MTRLFVIISLLAACERAAPQRSTHIVSDPRCPDGFSDELSGPGFRECTLPDGTHHGPVLGVDPDGHDYLVGHNEHGKREGRWTLIRKRWRSEVEYRDGVRDGRSVHWFDSRIAIDCPYRAGKRHGRCLEFDWEDWFADDLRTGVWRDLRDPRRTRVYANDVLIAVDGTAVPPPPEIVVDGHPVRIEDCAKKDVFAHKLCVDMFDALQTCADETCRRDAVARFRLTPSRKPNTAE